MYNKNICINHSGQCEPTLIPKFMLFFIVTLGNGSVTLLSSAPRSEGRGIKLYPPFICMYVCVYVRSITSPIFINFKLGPG